MQEIQHEMLNQIGSKRHYQIQPLSLVGINILEACETSFIVPSLSTIEQIKIGYIKN